MALRVDIWSIQIPFEFSGTLLAGSIDISCMYVSLSFSSAVSYLTILSNLTYNVVYTTYEVLVSPSLGGLGEEEWSELQQEADSLQQFWVELHQIIKATPSGSMLRDMAQLDLEVTRVGVPDNSEEKVRILARGESPGFSCM